MTKTHVKVRRLVTLFLALAIFLTYLPSAMAADGGQSIHLKGSVTDSSKTVTVTLAQGITGGFMRILELDANEDYDPSSFFSYSDDQILGNVYYGQLAEAGDITATLNRTPTAGARIYAILRDSSGGSIQEYVAGPVTVTAGTAVSPEQQILDACAVDIIGYTDGTLLDTATSITAKVTLPDSVKSCTLIVYAYPGNATFDPDTPATRRLYSVTAKNGETYECPFSGNLTKGEKVVAYLNVPVRETADDIFYRGKLSQVLDVVDENGQSFIPYTFPEVHIDETELLEGATSLHITLTGDERIFEYARQKQISITVSINQYPADEKFDFEETYMHSLSSLIEAKEAFEHKEITLSEPLLKGYRVRAVVYWSQNVDLWIPKSNDYEAANIPDDSVLITALPATPSPTPAPTPAASSFTLEAVGDVYAEDKAVTVNANYPSDMRGTFVYLFRQSGSTAPTFWDESDDIVGSSAYIGAVKMPGEIQVTVRETLNAGDVIIPVLRYINDDYDIFFKAGTPFTVKAPVEGDSMVFSDDAVSDLSETISVIVSGYDTYKDGYLILRVTSNPDDLDGGTRIGSQRYTGSGTYDFSLKSLESGKYLVAHLYKYDMDNDRTFYSSENPTLLIESKAVKEPTVSFTTAEIKEDSTFAYILADFDESATALLTVYSYAGDAFDVADADSVVLYANKVEPGVTATRIDFTKSLTPGNKIIAVLTVTDRSGNTASAQSESKVIKALPKIADPALYITEQSISEGDVNMQVSVNFERNYYDSVKLTVYNFEGEALDPNTATVLNETTLYTPNNNMTVGFNYKELPLRAGSKLVLRLTVLKNGKMQVFDSYARTVEAAPDWSTPTVSIGAAAIKEGTTVIPVTANYDEGYLTIAGGYYCNITLYQFPAKYTDEDFEEKELHEGTEAQRLGSVNAKPGELLAEVEIPINADLLIPGTRIIAKLRLPHPEWADSEMDYLSFSVPVIGEEEQLPEAKVLLYNLGEEAELGKGIRSILNELNIEAVTVERSQLNESVGYLIGLDGFKKADEPFTEDGYETPFMLMSDLGESLLDKVLAAMGEASVVIDHKAIRTNTNQYWPFKKLISEIEEEHETMTAWEALRDLAAEAKELDKSQAADKDLSAFESALEAAQAVLDRTDEPTAEDYKVAYNELKAALVALLGQDEPEPASPIKYAILEGKNGTWAKGDAEGLTVRANGDFDTFTGVSVDGTLLDASAYKAKAGSTIITLGSDYLQTLTAGEHRLTIFFTNGEATTNFTVTSAPAATEVPTEAPASVSPTPGATVVPKATESPNVAETPKTGDNSQPALWTALVTISIGALGSTMLLSRKKKEEDA